MCVLGARVAGRVSLRSAIRRCTRMVRSSSNRVVDALPRPRRPRPITWARTTCSNQPMPCCPPCRLALAESLSARLGAGGATRSPTPKEDRHRTERGADPPRRRRPARSHHRRGCYGGIPRRGAPLPPWACPRVLSARAGERGGGAPEHMPGAAPAQPGRDLKLSCPPRIGPAARIRRAPSAQHQATSRAPQPNHARHARAGLPLASRAVAWRAAVLPS